MRIRYSIISILGIFFGSFTSSYAQMNVMSEKRAAEFLGSTTYVELTEYKELNEVIRSEFQTYWTVTPYQFVTSEEMNLELKRVPKDPKRISLIRLVDYFGRKTSMKNEFTLLALFMGYRWNLKNYEEYDILTSEFLDFTGGEKWVYESVYMLGFHIKTMHEGLLALKNKTKYSAKQPSVLKTKTLLIASESLASRTKIGLGKKNTFDENSLEGYKYPYKILPLNEIKKIVADTSTQYCLFIPTASESHKDFRVYDLETRNMVYWWAGSLKPIIRKPPPFKKKDFEEVSMEIDAKKE